MARRKTEALVPVTGEVLPALSGSPAGFEAERLDPTLQELIDTGRTAAAAFTQALPILQQAMRLLTDKLALPEVDLSASQLLDRTSALAGIVDRSSRTVMNMVKALDEMSRLRSFLSGGPDSRSDEVQHMSDAQLVQMVLAAVGKCPKCGARLGGPPAKRGS